MMEAFWIVLFFAVVSIVSSCYSGVCFKTGGDGLKGFGLLLFSVSFTGLMALGQYKSFTEATIYHLAASQEGVYVVLKKVPDEKGAFLVLFDLKNNSERVAHLSEYPPKGFQEQVLTDGRTVLVVEGKQVVAGNPDKTEFIPPAK